MNENPDLSSFPPPPPSYHQAGRKLLSTNLLSMTMVRSTFSSFTTTCTNCTFIRSAHNDLRLFRKKWRSFGTCCGASTSSTNCRCDWRLSLLPCELFFVLRKNAEVTAKFWGKRNMSFYQYNFKYLFYLPLYIVSAQGWND